MASLRFARAYVVTMRPYLLFVSGAVGVAGLASAPGAGGLGALLVAAACFGSYGFGQALTDCFQLDTDSLSAPWRPLVRGELARRDVLRVSLAGLAGTGAALCLPAPGNLAVVGAAVTGLATYTRCKRIPWAGPPWNAAIVLLLFLAAWLAGNGTAGQSPRPDAALAATAGVVFFGYANFVLAGYFKDVGADRRTGYRTLPVVAGLRASAWTSDALAALAAGSALAAVAALRPTAPAGPAAALPLLAAGGLLVAGLSASLVAQVRLHRVSREAEAHRAIAPVVDALVLLLAGVSALARPDWVGPIVAGCVVYRWTLGRRPAASQI